ncbi:SRPBCC family protein [Amycolatopsis minnesotensis]|uniref:SRPBCC family protein n=1 Tax=Amycolatopsis minnesotensis TaxID=337894 RepID=A0ABP5BLG9_9PSEU
MIDLIDQIAKARRELGTRGDARTVLLRRTYDATPEDVWDACTKPERLARWLGPVEGDLRLGGRFQVEGNAGGEILRCDAPNLLAVSWVFGENPATNTSEVVVTLSPASGGTTEFQLEHVAVDVDPEHWAKFGPGAVGIGWDLSLLGLAAHLAKEESTLAPEELLQTPEALEFIKRSGHAWGAAHEAAGASPEEAAGARDRTVAVYTGAE